MLRSLLSDPLFGEGFGFAVGSNTVCMDWKETAEAHVFKLDLPGVAREDVKVQVHDGRILHVSADRKDEELKDYGGSSIKWHCRERGWGWGSSVCREFRLPENAVVEEIKAEMRDGVLMVTVPKDKKNKKKKKKKRRDDGVNDKRAVEIESAGDGGGQENSPAGKGGMSRFVCCKA